MSRYEGYRTKSGPIVTVDGRLIEPRLDLRNHSPTGLEWGYAGSGPAQLALAILAHHLGDDGQALAIYQDFKFAVIAKLPKQCWILSSTEIQQALESMPTERKE